MYGFVLSLSLATVQFGDIFLEWMVGVGFLAVMLELVFLGVKNREGLCHP
jgi:hypothetical protein